MGACSPPVWECLAPSPASPSPSAQRPGNVAGRQQLLAQVLESLPSSWEGWMNFQAPGFGLSQPWLLWACRGSKLVHRLSLFLSAFRVNR